MENEYAEENLSRCVRNHCTAQCWRSLADKPGAGWITIEKAIEVAKTKAGYVEVYAAEADDNGYWEVKGRKSDGTVYEARIDGASGNVLRDQKD